MRYAIVHRSSYRYTDAVEGALHAAVARPRSFESFWRTQRCLEHDLTIDPAPEVFDESQDAFGNHTCRFEIHRTHKKLAVTARSVVSIHTPPAPALEALNDSLPWEQVAAAAAAGRNAAGLSVLEQSLPTAMTPPSGPMVKYARESFTPGRPMAAAAFELCCRIFDDFRYDPAATDLATPVARVFEERAGVCQDFAHLQLAMLRGLRLPGRYLSGYVRTGNEPVAAAAADASGGPRVAPAQPGALPASDDTGLIGSDASHAWLAVHLGREGDVDRGWLDVDPTNRKVAGDEHLTLAWGRDYSDVSPLKGVLVGGGQHRVGVEVSVRPLPEPEREPEPAPTSGTGPRNGPQSGLGPARDPLPGVVRTLG